MRSKYGTITTDKPGLPTTTEKQLVQQNTLWWRL
jgi:hypothetical protein